MEGSPDTFPNFCGSCYKSQFKRYATSKMELCDRKGNSWKLLLTVVTEIFLLKVTGLLDPSPKNVHKFRVTHKSISSNILKRVKIYSKLTTKTT